MSDTSELAPLTVEGCRQYVYEEVFKHLPEVYPLKYPLWPGMVGVEIEMLVVDWQTSRESHPRLLPLNGPKSLVEALRKSPFGWKLYEGESGFRVELEEGDNLTFEPGGQLEFAGNPYLCLSDSIRRINEVQRKLDEWVGSFGAKILQVGMNPWHDPATIALQMAKPRYRAMDKYFRSIGPFGERMMRQTCTIQANFDFGEKESDMSQRYLLANLLAPFATAMFANSPVCEGNTTEFQTFRSHIWQNIDPSRTGFPDLRGVISNPSRQTCVDAYLESVLDAKVVYIADLQFKVLENPMSFRQWLGQPIFNIRPSLQDFEHHLSLHFPEVRPRGFLEIRSIDGQGRCWQSVPVAFYSALLYEANSMQQALTLLLPFAEKLKQFWSNARFGYRDSEIRTICQKLMDIAVSGFQKLPDCYQGEQTYRHLAAFKEIFTNKGRTPADDLKEWWAQGRVTPQRQIELEDHWSEQVERMTPIG